MRDLLATWILCILFLIIVSPETVGKSVREISDAFTTGYNSH